MFDFFNIFISRVFPLREKSPNFIINNKNFIIMKLLCNIILPMGVS